MKSLLSLIAWAATAAQAHITLEEPQASAGASYKALFRVGHGCAGSATHTLSVRLPPGFRGAKPMPKPGWTLSLQSTPADGVVEVTWRAASREAWLADAQYDEFVLRGQAPAVPGPAWFKVQQLCETGQWDWFDIPASGSSTRGLKAPAVLLEVLPKAPAAAHEH
jgi:uncharacterized protein YcnI